VDPRQATRSSLTRQHRSTHRTTPCVRACRCRSSYLCLNGRDPFAMKALPFSLSPGYKTAVVPPSRANTPVRPRLALPPVTIGVSLPSSILLLQPRPTNPSNTCSRIHRSSSRHLLPDTSSPSPEFQPAAPTVARRRCALSPATFPPQLWSPEAAW
jgi:hypothetical protein